MSDTPRRFEATNIDDVNATILDFATEYKGPLVSLRDAIQTHFSAIGIESVEYKPTGAEYSTSSLGGPHTQTFNVEGITVKMEPRFGKVGEPLKIRFQIG